MAGKDIKRMAIISRRRKVFEQRMRGTPVCTIAAGINCDEATIRDDWIWIRANWLNGTGDTVDDVRAEYAEAIARVEYIKELALSAFDRSRGKRTENKTERRPCSAEGCNMGILANDDWCDACEGRGYVEANLSLKEINNDVGDAKFLAIAHECNKEINRLKSLHQKPVVAVNTNNFTRVEHHETIDTHHLGRIEYNGAPREKVVAALKAIQELRKYRDGTVIESKVVSNGKTG